MRQSLVGLRGRSTNQSQKPFIGWLILSQRSLERFKSYNIKNEGITVKLARFFSPTVGSGFIWDVICHHHTCLGQRAPAFRMACSACHIKEIS